MDGLKSFLRTLRRIHFWLICPLVVIMGLVGWYLTIGKLQTETKKNRSDIESKFGSTESLGREQIHPNDDVAQGMNKLISARQTEVAAAWQEKWNQQTRDGGVLVWPDFDWPENTKREFLAKVKDKRPIEKEVPFPLEPKDDLRIGLRRLYRDYIQDELPKLAEMVGAVWLPAEGRGARAGRSDSNLRSDDAIVAWDGANQKELQDAHFNWEQSSRRQQPGVRGDNAPTMLEILYAQEDLWVLRAVMQVIQRANANATARFNATVKEIEWLRIGNQAIRSKGRITRVEDSGASMTDDQGLESQLNEVSREMEFESGLGGTEGMGGVASGPDPSEGRYVDKDYKKLEENKLRTVMQNTEGVAPEDAYLVVAKRIPVRMRLKVDQRKLHRLLVECANSELTIEVREIRINPSDNARTPMMRRPRGEDINNSANEKTFSYDLIVEIYGIVYIYNPVDRSIIGDEEGDGAPVDEGDVALFDSKRARSELLSGA